MQKCCYYYHYYYYHYYLCFRWGACCSFSFVRCCLLWNISAQLPSLSPHLHVPFQEHAFFSFLAAEELDEKWEKFKRQENSAKKVFCPALMKRASTIFTMVSPLEENAAEAKARPWSGWERVSWVWDMWGFFLESLTVFPAGHWKPLRKRACLPGKLVVHAVLCLSEGEALFVGL